ncbi:MAG: NAD(P)/FAD-dependent oxidoreductase [Vicinamibacteria bacterium]|nr:NAD(P)/FAD-dependent oxidoreductase [Vicinamibacteria bacterium]
MSRPIIIGAGHNGLVCAAYLARAGLRPLVLEARDEVGGCAVTHELMPGVRVPALTHTVALGADVVRDLGLDTQGLHVTSPAVSVCVPTKDGRALVVPRGTAAAVRALAPWSARDAERWPAFVASTQALTQAMGAVLGQVPPSLDAPSPSEMWVLLRAGRKLRGLGRQGLYDLLRWGPMPIADLAAEWFETPALRAAVCARGVFGMQAGPRSAGTTAAWLLQAAQEGHPTGAVTVVSGGPGAMAAALAVAATSAGAQIRRTARVARIEIDDDGVRGVVLDTGERIEARAVISGADPKHTFLQLVDPVHLQPSFRQQVLNYRAHGVVAKVNLVVTGLPEVAGLDASGMPIEQALAGRLLVGDEPDELERAFDCTKYGRMSDRPWLEVTVPSLTDASLAPAGQHVLSIYAQYAPYRLREGDWDSGREALGDLVVSRLAEVMPDLKSQVLAGEVLTPLDLERGYGLTGGHIFHGEHTLDQLYAMRPVLGWAQHRTPIHGLYLCGAGTHPGGGVTGAPGAHAARVVGKDLRRARA